MIIALIFFIFRAIKNSAEIEETQPCDWDKFTSAVWHETNHARRVRLRDKAKAKRIAYRLECEYPSYFVEVVYRLPDQSMLGYYCFKAMKP